MSSSTMSAIYGRCFAIFMAVVILIEGVFYLGLAIWGLVQEDCSEQTNNINNNPFQFTTDLIYFINQKCGETVTATQGTNEVSIAIDWNVSSVITNRMNIFLITYAVISGLWILFSALVLMISCGTITKVKSAIFYWPWFAVVIAGSVLDIVASGYFISDITHTTSAQATFAFIGASPTNVNDFASYDSYFATPAIVMTCISSRIILIWLMNVFGVSFCISIVSSTLSSKASTNQAVSAASTSAMLAAEQNHQVPTSPKPQAAYETQPAIVEQNVQIRPKPLPIQTPQEYAGGNPMEQQSQMAPKHYSITEQPQQEAIHVAPYRYSVEPQQTRTYQNTETHPDNLNYPSGRMIIQPPQPQQPAQPPQSQATPRPITATSELSTASALNNRYSQPEYVPAANAPSRVSDELRSQLPWSYTSMLVKPPVPRKPPTRVYPDIPEPDYGEQRGSGGGGGGDRRQSQEAVRQSQEGYSKW